MPDRIQSATELSRQVGAVELTARPIAAANVCNTTARAAAINPPAMIAGQCTRGQPSGRVSSVVKVMTRPRSAQAEERQNGQDHDNQPDKIDNAVHWVASIR